MEKLTYYSCSKRKTRPISMLFFSISWLQTYYSNIKQPSSSCSRGEQCTCIHTIQYSFIQLCFISQGPSIMCIDSIVQSEIPRMRNFWFAVVIYGVVFTCQCFFFIHYCHVVATCYSLSFCARDLTQSYRILFLGVCPANKTGTMSSSSITTINNLWA